MHDNSGAVIGVLGKLQIIFIGLKLLGIVNWTWPVVLIPLWIDLGLILIALLFAIIWEMFS